MPTMEEYAKAGGYERDAQIANDVASRGIDSFSSAPSSSNNSRDNSSSDSSSSNTPPASLGSLYKPVKGTDMWSTHPDNPNSLKFNADGSKVASIGFDFTNTGGPKFDGYGTVDQSNTIRNLAQGNDAAGLNNYLMGLYKNGSLASNNSIYGNKQGGVGGSSGIVNGGGQGNAPTDGWMVGGANATQTFKADSLTPMAGYVKNPTVDAMSTVDQLNYYKAHADEARQEILRAKQVYDSAKTDAQRTDAHNWADQLRQATGITDSNAGYGNNNGIDAETQRRYTDALLGKRNIVDPSAGPGAGTGTGSTGGGTGGTGTTAGTGQTVGTPSQSYIDQLNAAKQQAVIAQLGKSRDAALSNLGQEQAGIQPKYYDQRNQVAAGAQQQARNFQEFMAARGGSSAGSNAQAELMNGMATQGSLGSLGRQEAQAYTDIGRRTTDVQNAYQSDVASSEAGMQADKMQALLQDYYNQRQFDLTKTTTNLNNEGQVLANQLAKLQLDNYPEQTKTQAKIVQQQLEKGDLDLATAQFKLEELKNPDSPVNQAAKIDLQLKQMDLQNAPVETQLKLEQIRKQIAQIGAAPYKSATDRELDQVKLDTAKKQLDLLNNPNPKTDNLNLDDYKSHINQSYYKDQLVPGGNGTTQKVFDSKSAESYILSLNITNEQKAQLYQLYNIPLKLK